MRTIQKITRASAIYGIVLDKKSLIELLSQDVEFTKHLLLEPDSEVAHYIYSKFGETKDRNFKWAWGEVTEGTEIFIFGREISKMRNDETFGEFKSRTETSIYQLIKTEFSCSIFSIPEGVDWS